MRKKSSMVCGVGINDYDGIIYQIRDGKQLKIPSYQTWKDMITRCYSPKCQKRNPSYIGCSVSDSWLYFTNFKVWFDNQKTEGLMLDKDLINPGNKIYSEESCVFVTQAINNLLTDRKNTNKDLPIGVYWNKEHRKFKAQCSCYGKRVHLGYFNEPETAHIAYVIFRKSYLLEVAETQLPAIRNGIIKHAELLN